MLSGRRAFARDHTVDTLHAILHEAPAEVLEQRHDVPPALSALVRRLLERTPDARPRSAADVGEALDEIAGAGSQPELPLLSGATSRHSPRIARPALALAAVLIVLAAAVGWVNRREAASAPARTASTLAILPFRSLPDSADDQLLELGLADAFISRLSHLPELRVLPLSATEPLRAADPRDAGRTLGVDRVLTATVQRDQTRVRATVQLLSISEDRVIWSTTFDDQAASAFSIQDAVVARVLQEIALQLTASARARLLDRGTRNSEAFESYLRGRAHAAQATGAEFSRAADSFRQAVTIDPDYADAWAALGAASVRLPLVGGVRPAGPFSDARVAATRALDLAPDHAGAEWVLGTVAFWFEWDYPRAEALLRRAATRQPDAAEAQVYLAHLLSNLGRHDEALFEIGRARARDPALPIARSLQGQFLFMARRFDEALSHMDSMVGFAPTFVQGHVMRAYPLVSLGRYDEAIRACDRALELEAGMPPSALVGTKVFPRALRGYALARAGRRAEAEAILHDIRSLQRESYVPPTHVALILHGLGRNEEALAELKRAVEIRDPALTFLGVDPKWDELRGWASFQAVVSRVNLLDVSNAAIGRR